MRSVELFAGAGGLGIGASRAGFKPEAVVEWDRWCADTIRENATRDLEHVAHWPLTHGDVRDFDYSQISDGVDLVSGGPPCQPFSLGGKHRGKDDARDMFPEAVRAVRELRPKAFMFENVKGLTRSTFASYLEYVRLQLTYPELVAKKDEEWEDHLGRLEKYHLRGKPTGLHYRLVMRPGSIGSRGHEGPASRQVRVSCPCRGQLTSFARGLLSRSPGPWGLSKLFQ